MHVLSEVARQQSQGGLSDLELGLVSRLELRLVRLKLGLGLELGLDNDKLDYRTSGSSLTYLRRGGEEAGDSLSLSLSLSGSLIFSASTSLSSCPSSYLIS